MCFSGSCVSIDPMLYSMNLLSHWHSLHSNSHNLHVQSLTTFLQLMNQLVVTSEFKHVESRLYAKSVLLRA